MIRLELLGGLAEPLVVDVAGVGVDLVLLDLVDLPGEVRGVAVREVAAVVQIEREDLVAGIEYGVVDRLVRLRSGVRLDVDVVGAPQLFRAIDRERLDLVGVLAAGVVALARIPSAYLFVRTLPCASSTASLTWFSLAIIASVCSCLSRSPASASATSGSTSRTCSWSMVGNPVRSHINPCVTSVVPYLTSATIGAKIESAIFEGFDG